MSEILRELGPSLSHLEKCDFEGDALFPRTYRYGDGSGLVDEILVSPRASRVHENGEWFSPYDEDYFGPEDGYISGHQKKSSTKAGQKKQGKRHWVNGQ